MCRGACLTHHSAFYFKSLPTNLLKRDNSFHSAHNTGQTNMGSRMDRLQVAIAVVPVSRTTRRFILNFFPQIF